MCSEHAAHKCLEHAAHMCSEYAAHVLGTVLAEKINGTKVSDTNR